MAVIETIEASIAELIAKLPQADSKEAARIHTRIEELEAMKAKYST